MRVTFAAQRTRIQIKHGEYHVSVDSSTSRLYLSKTEPVLTLYKHTADDTLRNENGDKCVAEGALYGLYLGDYCEQSFEYIKATKTYQDNRSNVCWKSVAAIIETVICDSAPQGFVEVILDALNKPSESLSSASQSKSVPTPTRTNYDASTVITSESYASDSSTTNVAKTEATPRQSLSASPQFSNTSVTPTITQYDLSYKTTPKTTAMAKTEATPRQSLPVSPAFSNTSVTSTITQYDWSYTATPKITAMAKTEATPRQSLSVSPAFSTSVTPTITQYDLSYTITPKITEMIVPEQTPTSLMPLSTESKKISPTTAKYDASTINTPEITASPSPTTNAEKDKYSIWSPWSKCSASCSGGTRTRTRFCDADFCNGRTDETTTCNDQPCAIHGGFSAWSSWSTCDAVCGGGQRNKTRRCNNPAPQHGGYDCFGDTIKREICNVQRCPVHGNWTKWTNWTACDKPCNTGMHRRWRFCTNPTPLFGGNDCIGKAMENVTCNIRKCPAEKILVKNLAIQQAWHKGMALIGSPTFNKFQQHLMINMQRTFRYSHLYQSYLFTTIESIKKQTFWENSIVVTLKISFAGLDSFQMLLLQDSLENDNYLGKMKIIHSPETQYETSLVPAVAPSNLTITPLEESSIQAEWNSVPTNVSGYIIFYREMECNVDYKILPTLKTTAKITGLKPNTRYAIRIVAYNENGNGVASKMNFASTKESVPSQPPKHITATGTSGRTVNVQWMRTSSESWNGEPVGTFIMYNSSQGHSGNVIVPYPATLITITDLHPVTLYIISVCQVTRPGYGPCQKTEATTLLSTPSEAPGKVEIINTKHNELTVQWKQVPPQHSNGDLIGYKIRVSLVKIGGILNYNNNTNEIYTHPCTNRITLTDLHPNSEYSISVLAFNEFGDGISSSPNIGETCAYPPVIYTNFYSHAPYVHKNTSGHVNGLFAEILRGLMSPIYNNCIDRNQSTINFQSDGNENSAEKETLQQMTKDIGYVDVSFPIFGRTFGATHHGHVFVPVVPHPGVVHFRIRNTWNEQALDVTLKIRETWPLFVISILLIIIAGFFVWALDSRENPEDFPQSFLRGAFSGFYWAYVTMTTVGYGDLTPRSKPARVFAMVWMIVGVVVLALLSGKLATSLIATQARDTTLYGKEIAAIPNSTAYTIAVRRNAKVNTKALYRTIDEVADALKKRQIRSALVDVASVASRPDLFSHPDIYAVEQIKHPFSFGFVVSKDMTNAASTLKDYVNVEQQRILQTLAAITAGFKVKKEAELLNSFINAQSFIYQITVVAAMSIILIVVATCQGRYKFKIYHDTYTGGTIQYPAGTAHRNELMEAFQSDVRAMEGKLDAIIEKFTKKHIEQRFDFKEDPRDVPDKHIKWIREQRRKEEERQEMRRRAAVPESTISGRSDESTPYVMEEDEIQPLPGMADFWSSHHQDALRDERKKDYLEKNKDTCPNAVSAQSGQNIVYVDISCRTRGRRAGDDQGGQGDGMPPVA